MDHGPSATGAQVSVARLLTSPLKLNSSHAHVECMAVEGTQPGGFCLAILLFILALE